MPWIRALEHHRRKYALTPSWGQASRGHSAFAHAAAFSFDMVLTQLRTFGTTSGSAFIAGGTETPRAREHLLLQQYLWRAAGIQEALRRCIELKRVWSSSWPYPCSCLPLAWAPAWMLPSEMLRNRAPGSNLGNWLEAVIMEQKEEMDAEKRYTEKQGGNVGMERRECWIDKEQKMSTTEGLDKWDLTENSQRTKEWKHILYLFKFVIFSPTTSLTHADPSRPLLTIHARFSPFSPSPLPCSSFWC